MNETASLGLDGKFWKICMPTRAFWGILYDNWSTEWVNFALLNTNVEAFLNQLSYYRQLYNVTRE